MGACIKMFVVANCLGGVIEAGIQVEMGFLEATLFSILKIISAICHTVGYQYLLNKEVCIHMQ